MLTATLLVLNLSIGASLAAAEPTPASAPTPLHGEAATPSPAPTSELPDATPTPLVTPPPAPSPPAMPHKRERASRIHRELQFLVGDWEVAAESLAADGTMTPAGGNVSVRFDLGGLLLLERWALAGSPHSYDARVLWSYDGHAAVFRAFHFDSAGASGDEYRGSAGKGVVILERRFSEEGRTRIERRTYGRGDRPEKSRNKQVVVTVERGDEGQALLPMLTATWSRSER